MIEICCGSYYDAMQAYIGGVTRIELNSALHLGGLTPSVASLVLTKTNTQLEVMCMIRCRGAGFCYLEEEYTQMFLEARDLLEAGADGIVFGFLEEDRTINIEKTKQMIELIKEYNKVAVFHRAIDCVKQVDDAMNLLIDLGIDRVLTSGGQATAIAGKTNIKELLLKYGKQIEILPGSGINFKNVNDFLLETGVTQVHSSCKEWLVDKTTHQGNVDFSYQRENEFEVVSLEYVRGILENMK